MIQHIRFLLKHYEFLPLLRGQRVVKTTDAERESLRRRWHGADDWSDSVDRYEAREYSNRTANWKEW